MTTRQLLSQLSLTLALIACFCAWDEHFNLAFIWSIIAFWLAWFGMHVGG